MRCSYCVDQILIKTWTSRLRGKSWNSARVNQTQNADTLRFCVSPSYCNKTRHADMFVFFSQIETDEFNFQRDWYGEVYFTLNLNKFYFVTQKYINGVLGNYTGFNSLLYDRFPRRTNKNVNTYQNNSLLYNSNI